MRWVIAALVIWFLFVHRLADRDLWSSHEARSGMNARTILDGGIWWLPGRTSDLPDVQKPPMYYWMVAFFSGESSNVGPLTIRLPSTLGAMACIFSIYFIGCLQGEKKTGFLAAIICSTAVHFVWSSRIGRIDMPLAGAVNLYFLFALRFILTWKTSNLVLASLMVTIAILLKGPVGLVLCGIAALAILLTKARNISAFCGLGLTGFLGLIWAVPWFWAAHLATNGEFSRLFFIEHNLDRGMGSGRLRTHPIWFYPVQFMWDFQPWTTLLAFLYLLSSYKIKNSIIFFKSIQNTNFVFFFLCVFFLSLSSFKRADYLLPAYPSASYIFAKFINKLLETITNTKTKWLAKKTYTLGITTTLCAFVWLLYIDIPEKEPSRMAKNWAIETNTLIGRDDLVIFFAEEAHSLAFHLNRPHEVLGTPEELLRFLQKDKPVWVITNPQVVKLWPSGPIGATWHQVSSNIQPKDGQTTFKPLVLLKAYSDSKPR